MSDKGYSKWLTGCGIGCGLLLVLAIGAGLTIFMYTRSAVRELDQISKSVSRVDKEFGRVEDFTPEPDGRIPPDRVEAFLAVRKATVGPRGELARSIRTLETEFSGPTAKPGGFWHAIRAVRTGVGALPQIARFNQARADALIENKMGQGEYSYIYCLAYYSYLKKDPGDGPDKIKLSGSNSVSWEGHDGPAQVREQSRHAVMSYVRRSMTAILQNAVRQAEKGGAAEKTPWQETAEKELNELNSQWQRVPWADGLPQEIEQSFSPFRQDLEQGYDPLLNMLEFIPVGQH